MGKTIHRAGVVVSGDYSIVVKAFTYAMIIHS